MYSFGMDIGYSAVKTILIDEKYEIKHSSYTLHKGDLKNAIHQAMDEMLEGMDLNRIQFGAVTGTGGKLLAQKDTLVYVNEVAAVVEGSKTIHQDVRSIIEIGGESAKYITGFKGDSKSEIEISINSNCSAGTGSFLEEQMGRLNLRLEDYSLYASRAKSIPRIAGRCSVFAKTDITHHQQEGVSAEDILLGLAYAVARNYRGTVMRKLPVEKPILFAGGVTYNQGVITALKDILELDDDDLIIPEHSGNMGALGAAVMARKDRSQIDIIKLIDDLECINKGSDYEGDEIESFPLLPFGNDDSVGKHVCKPLNSDKGRSDCYLGIDIGSTNTNLVLMDEKDQVIAYKYVRTLGNPVEAVRKGLQELKHEWDDKINVIGVGTTGSGRYMIGDLIGADVIKDEITAQAKAAVTMDSDVDTIFEIGGQDSKFINIKDGIVTDFQMNKVCAAGTGSFIEEQAHKFNISMESFGKMALESTKPVNLGERCTVFIETSIAANLAKGKKMADIASGLCYSIARNYLGRVVGQKRTGEKIFFQGGVAYNPGVVNAFRALTGKDIYVPPFFSVTGAYGVAILTKEERGREKTGFKGFDIERNSQMIEEIHSKKMKSVNRSVFNEKTTKLLFKDYDGTLDTNKKTVGIPRALFAYGMFSMFSQVFKELDFNVLLSDPTSESTIALGQKYTLDEACYPMKIILGHVAELVEKKVDYIFFPDLFSVHHPGSASRVNYGCAYMQMAFKVIDHAMELRRKDIGLLAPTIAFSLGKEFMMNSFGNMGKQLGRTKEQMHEALKKGMGAFQAFEERLMENGKQELATVKPDEKIFVMISKVYGVADPMLNMGIPTKLMEMGYKVVSFYDLPEGDISKEHPNMYWPFGQHILEPAQFIKEHPNMYAILLTHHGCGPDSMLTHYFKESMDGKPFLHIEVDEHSSGVGIITRVEAFINSLESMSFVKAENMETYSNRIAHKDVNIKKSLDEINKNSVVYLPFIDPYSEIFKALLVKRGVNAKVLPPTTKGSAYMGRKFSLTEEYFSITSLLGDVFKELQSLEEKTLEHVAIYLPQNEGTEADGQYARLLRTKLDEEGYEKVDIIAPFIEDLLFQDERHIKNLCLGLLAGDIVRTAHKKVRDAYLSEVLSLIESDQFEIGGLKEIAERIYAALKTVDFNRRILAVGEHMVLYNEYLNNGTFSTLEENGHRIVYSPLSEMVLMFLHDFVQQNEIDKTPPYRSRLNLFKKYIKVVSGVLLEESPFDKDYSSLADIADRTVGYYSGANGRYRIAKILSHVKNMDGIITVASMYENTGIVMNALYKGFEIEIRKPLLNLTFDGNKNVNDETKIDSFMYYLKQENESDVLYESA